MYFKFQLQSIKWSCLFYGTECTIFIWWTIKQLKIWSLLAFIVHHVKIMHWIPLIHSWWPSYRENCIYESKGSCSTRLIQTNTDTEPGRMSLWCSAMVCHYTRWQMLHSSTKIYTPNSHYTDTHSHTPTDEHLRKQMLHSKRTGAIPKSYFWKPPLTNINI